MSQLINPGTDNQPAGNYIEVGPNGEEVENPRTITIEPGEKLPPTQEAGHKWTQI
nr:YjzC family protein [uncultured Cellulosilyticum sp.]